MGSEKKGKMFPELPRGERSKENGDSSFQENHPAQNSCCSFYTERKHSGRVT